MLIRFSVENYLSFKERLTIDLNAGTIKEHQDNTFSPLNSPSEKLLKSIVIYGANASGKSNLLKAFAFMKQFVLNSSKESQALEDIPVESFKLNTRTENQASYFEATFFLDNRKYRYGFTVSNKLVEQEWLFFSDKKKEESLFIRAGQDFKIEKKFASEAKGKAAMLSEITRNNALYLSVLAQFNGDISVKICDWFRGSMVSFESNSEDMVNYTASLLANPEYKRKIFDVIKKSDLGFTSITEEIKEKAAKLNVSENFLSMWYSQEIKNYQIKTQHQKFNENNSPVDFTFFDLLKNESLGTQKYFGLLGPIIVALTERRLILIDELDSRFHELLLQLIIKFFNSNINNPWGAQLICTCHNTSLLKKHLRRDQMFFTEKNEYGSSSIISLYHKDPKIRNDASFDKDYSLGKYGSIPKLDTQLKLFDR